VESHEFANNDLLCVECDNTRSLVVEAVNLFSLSISWKGLTCREQCDIGVHTFVKVANCNCCCSVRLLQTGLLCVKWDVKLYTLTHSSSANRHSRIWPF